MSRTTMMTLTLATALLSGGCAGMLGGGVSSLGNTATAIEAPAFTPPSDPSMGQIVLAVPEVTVSAPRGRGVGDLAQAVRSQLTSALASSPNFLVADRESLGEIAEEHRLGDSGAMAPSTKPVAGRLVGARYLVKVDVTELEERVVGNSDGGRLELGKVFKVLDLFVGGDNFKTVSDVAKQANPTVGLGKETVEGVVGLEVRVVDVDSGLVVANTRSQAKLKRDNTATVLGVGGLSTSSKQFAQSVLAHATRAAAEQATVKLHEAIRGLGAAPKAAAPATLASKP